MSKYDDIINLPHHISGNHRQMSRHDRAAQFAPFAALTGYDEVIAETTRRNEQSYETPIGEQQDPGDVFEDIRDQEQSL